MAAGYEHVDRSSDLVYARQDLARAQREIDETTRAFDATWLSTLEIQDKTGSRTYKGRAADLAAKFDSRSRVTFSLSAPSGYGTNVKVSIAADETFVYLAVSGSDESWTDASYAALENEIALSVPWWRVLRHNMVNYVLWFATSWVALNVALMDVLIVETTADKIITSVFTTVIPVGIGVAMSVITPKAIPAFQVVDVGEKPRGATAIGLIAAAAGQILLGLAVNAIS